MCKEVALEGRAGLGLHMGEVCQTEGATWTALAKLAAFIVRTESSLCLW